MHATPQQYSYHEPGAAQGERGLGAMFADWNRTFTHYVSERPVVALVGALCIGFVFGRIFARK